MKPRSAWDGVIRRYVYMCKRSRPPFTTVRDLGPGRSYISSEISAEGQALTDYQVFPNHRIGHTVGPGVEIKEDPIERRRRNGQEMDVYTSLE